MHPNDTVSPSQPSDKELAKIAYEAAYSTGCCPDFLPVVHALRAALMPPVEPLDDEGAVIDIDDPYTPGWKLHIDITPYEFCLAVDNDGLLNETIPNVAGVRKLRDACNRWLAAQDRIAREDDDGDE